ncbi:cyclodeaminase/cyclohydrolase family protein [Geosporobacter ferrireducens]|uniref:Sugar ABC transporter substrate-binding protein n=1 Tax=Geosporobacter ferrireducens TaxID=1424294 RepID=A0A1D8GE95_9FIRM|nr:cyclodeaminase/cyclohydrolase family protein [Geosporobacter ferrireducens]AOT69219.1 sugar ABC transporter substrate-binding protein [Geosporobacter ferrireducens]MTI56899.1 cyclodeaminase/cyclohydrolase family protein [Geosporobacter ferrireducens]
MKLVEQSCSEFTSLLSSKAAVPGGGGAAALVGGLGTALAGMVCNLTIGKKKYQHVEENVKEILAKAEQVQRELLDMVDEDAEHFLPLSKAYGMPSNTEEEKNEKARVLEIALKQACEVPIRIVKTCYDAIKLHEELVDKGSKLAISDVGVGVQCLRAALISGQLNVMINIGMIKDEDYVQRVKTETEKLVQEGTRIADEVYQKVEKVLYV